MNFWDTVKGHQLADVLIQTLPDLTDFLGKMQRTSKPVQYVRREETCMVGNCIEREILAGARLIGVYPYSSASENEAEQSVIVFETEN